jgi:hypothetical protein
LSSLPFCHSVSLNFTRLQSVIAARFNPLIRNISYFEYASSNIMLNIYKSFTLKIMVWF